jgi:ribonuclease III
VVLPAERLEKALGYSFVEKQRLKQALTHRSFAATHNERIEFVGDGILNALIARALFLRFPKLSEGELSRTRANLVCQDGLALIAAELNLGEYLWLGEGELKSGGHKRPSILADALESVLGAIWLDGGFAAVEAVVEKLFEKRLAAIDPSVGSKDAKTALQEWLQARKFALPVYTVLRQEGESPEQVFEMGCVAADVETRAEGPSRRTAEQVAAAEALRLLIERHPGKGKKK